MAWKDGGWRIAIGLGAVCALLLLARALDAPARLARGAGRHRRPRRVGARAVRRPLRAGDGAVPARVHPDARRRGRVRRRQGRHPGLGGGDARAPPARSCSAAIWSATRWRGGSTRYPRFAAIDEAVAREGWKIVLLTRLSPAFPFNLLNYAFGLTRVRLRDYVLASWIGMMPGTVMYVYVGSLAGDLAAIGQAERVRTPAEWGLYAHGPARHGGRHRVRDAPRAGRARPADRRLSARA